MKVFISHSTIDKAFVLELAKRINEANIDTWLCEVDIATGDNFIAEIEKGLSESDLILLIWSPEAAASPWTEKEWNAALIREADESRTRLAMVLLRDAPIPVLLRSRQGIDACSGKTQAIRETVKWLIEQRDMRRFEGAKAAATMLDYEPTGFIGRAQYLDRLYMALVEKQGKFLLWGGPGSGKSTIALKFAWRTQGAFDAVIFQYCGQRTVEEVVAELAARIKMDIAELPPPEQIAKVHQWLTERKTLLVLDDVWHRDMEALIPKPPCPVSALSILLTSRQRTLPFVEPPNSMQVSRFLPEEAEALFRTYLKGEKTDKHRSALRDLALRVDCLPIAVAVAADMLYRQLDPLDATAQTLKLEELHNQVHDVPRLLRQAIDSQPPPEQGLLQSMAVCHPDGFWFPLAVDISGHDAELAKKLRNRLIQASLVKTVDRERQRFRLHALLREQVLTTDGIQSVEKNYTRIIFRMFEGWEDQWQRCRECLADAQSVTKLMWTHGMRKEASDLSFRGAETCRRVGKLNVALTLLQTMETRWKNVDDVTAKNGLQKNYGQQALIFQAWGQFKEAMDLLKFQETLCIELKNKKGLLKSYGNQALILKNWGQFDEAMAMFAKVEDLCEELNNDDALQKNYGNQAIILKNWGRLDEAMDLLKKKENLCIILDNKDSLQKCYGNQALVMRAQGKLDEAMDLHKQEEALCIKLGNRDGLQISYGNQAIILKEWGKLDEAMTLHKNEEALCIALGNNNSLQRSYGHQAMILQEWGQLDEALGLFEKQENLCMEMGLISSLGYCYWAWGLLARELKDHDTESSKLDQALQIFSELNMPAEMEAVQKAIEKI